jgi:hypothetical protein
VSIEIDVNQEGIPTNGTVETANGCIQLRFSKRRLWIIARLSIGAWHALAILPGLAHLDASFFGDDKRGGRRDYARARGRSQLSGISLTVNMACESSRLAKRAG